MSRDLNALLEQVQSISADVIEKESAMHDKEATWPMNGIRELQKVGLAGLVVPESAGGYGQGLEMVVRTCETIGYHCPSTALCMGMHHVATAVIAAKATEDQETRYLEPIAAGKHLTTLALSEPGTGVHFYYPETKLTTNDRGFTLDGRKSFITSGSHADSYVVSTAAADPDAPPALFSCVLVPSDADGLEWGRPFEGFGMRGNSARSVRLDGVHVPKRDLLGEEGDQIWYVFNVVAPFFLVGMAGTYLGLAQRALDVAIDHLKTRQYEHSGQGLDQAPVLQHRIGGLWADVQRTRRLVYWAAAEADRGGDQALPALCMAKAEVGHCAVDVCNEAMTLCGGKAYDSNDLLARLLRDARAAHVMAPTTDILQTWAGRALLGLPLLEE